MPAPDVMGMLMRLLQSSPPAATPLGGTDQQFAQSIAQQSRFDTEGERSPTGELPSPGLPPGLPDAVMRSILTQPSYGEGQLDPLRRVPGQLPFDTQMAREWSFDRRSRTGGERLYNELGDWRDFQKFDQPLPEGMRPYTDQFRGQPMYPSPLNSLMGRLPGMGLY